MGTIPTSTTGKATSPFWICLSLSCSSPAPKSPLPSETCLRPSLLPTGRYCICTWDFRLLYSRPHLAKRATGIVDPEPTRMVFAWIEPAPPKVARQRISANQAHWFAEPVSRRLPQECVLFTYL